METQPKLVFKYGWNEQDDIETPMKGCRNDGIVQAPNGLSYSVYFIDPVRLQQDLDEEVELGSPFLAFPGLIILPELTKKAMEHAVLKLWKQGYFKLFKPMDEVSEQVA